MRPTLLIMDALGPFPATQKLDFTTLGNRSLFLIHGPTGSGKTTILDAMCFALYGEPSGGERPIRGLRSDHADPHHMTQVTYEFQLGSERFRVTRRPDQDRPKKRGEGFVNERRTAALWKITNSSAEEDAQVLADSWDDVTAKVVELLGFRIDQFRQVVMLPQGQFRRLLLANSRERQEILEVLFQTSLYTRIQQALREAAKTDEDRERDATRERDLVLSQAGVDSVDELNEVLTALKTRHRDIHARMEALAAEDKKARERLTEGRRISEKLEETGAAEADLAVLREQVPAYDTKRSRLEKAQRAQGLEGDRRALEQHRKELDAAQRAKDKAHGELVTARRRLQEAEVDLDAEKGKQSERDAALRRTHALDELSGQVNELADSLGHLASAGKALTRTIEASKKVAQDQQQVRSHIAQARETLDELTTVVGNRELLETRSAEAERHLKAREQLEKERKRAENIATELADALKDVHTAGLHLTAGRERFQLLETAWIQGQAAILAQGLVPDEPCPVCGSREHPAPASTATDLPNESVLNDARAEIEQLADQREHCLHRKADVEKRLAEVETSVGALEAGLDELASKPVKYVRDIHKRVARELTQAVEADAEAKKLAEEMASQETLLASLAERREELAQQEAHARIEHEKWAAIVAEREARIPENLRDVKSLEREQAEARQAVRTLDAALENAQEAFARAGQEAARAQAAMHSAEDTAAESALRVLLQTEELDRRLKEKGFRNQAELDQSALDSSAMEDLAENIRAFDSRMNACVWRLERARQAAEGLSEPDLAQLEEGAQLSRQALETATNDRAEVKARLDHLEKLLQQYHQVSQRLAKLESRTRMSKRLSEVANGNNPAKLSFQRYVLAALLDDVLDAASQRLKRMSSGRFMLQRVRDPALRKRFGGLEMQVTDAYTGTAREVGTLSGGESFLASLSLALGLSDVVQAYSGGIRLETVFVDEGFGSLDTEALDLAFRALVDLQQSGRLVGVISHVSELREQIKARLEVRSTSAGSTARFVVP